MAFIGLSVTGYIKSPHLKEGDISKLTSGIDYMGTYTRRIFSKRLLNMYPWMQWRTNSGSNSLDRKRLRQNEFCNCNRKEYKRSTNVLSLISHSICLRRGVPSRERFQQISLPVWSPGVDWWNDTNSGFKCNKALALPFLFSEEGVPATSRYKRIYRLLYT